MGSPFFMYSEVVEMADEFLTRAFLADPLGEVDIINKQIGNLSASKVDKIPQQTTEQVALPLLKVIPKTSGIAPFQIIQNSFANSVGGAGTYNHGVWFGWNASRHADSAGDVTNNSPAIYMGFEDNYFDPNVDLKYGSEWYVGYVSPDGTSVPVADLRPFYTRITDSNTNSLDKSVITTLDIGSGANGSLGIWGSLKSGKQLLSITQTQVLSYLPLNVLGNGQYSPQIGDALLLIKANQAGKNTSIRFQPNGLAGSKFTITADQFSEIYLYDDTNGRVHVNFVQGASDTAALSEFSSSVKIHGNVGFYNTTPVAKQTITGAKGGNAALASLLTALQSIGLITDTTTA